MHKDEILKLVQIEKLDEGRKYSNDFALGVVGAFSFIAIILMIVYKNIINEGYEDLLSLLMGMVGAFCYGKFVLTSRKYWLVVAVILFLGAGVIFLEMPGL